MSLSVVSKNHVFGHDVRMIMFESLSKTKCEHLFELNYLNILNLAFCGRASSRDSKQTGLPYYWVVLMVRISSLVNMLILNR